MEVHFQLNSNSSSCVIFNSMTDYGADHGTFLSLPKSTTEAAGVRVFCPVPGFWPVAVAFALRSVETWRINKEAI